MRFHIVIFEMLEKLFIQVIQRNLEKSGGSRKNRTHFVCLYSKIIKENIEL